MTWLQIFTDPALGRKLDENTKALNLLRQEIKNMVGEVQRLKDAVAKLDTVEASIIALINGLAGQIRDLVAAGADPAALSALADDVNAKADEMAKAVTDNTPAAPPPA